MIRSQVLICGGTGCTSSGSKKIQSAFVENLEKHGLTDEIRIVQTGCFGLCALGPVVIVYPDGTFYSMVKPEDVPEIVEEHLLKGRVVERLVYNETSTPVEDLENVNVSLDDTDFYKSQHRVALRNCGVIDPENIDEYIAMDGYAALGKVLTEMTPEEVIEVVKASGLRGRG
ncbi:MAG: NAD(P)H-dependent oxidoreductase subunit E, partial [Eubacterium sp.]|nr:NAD(P)H-dependent oxidoreductase subunit E [Eubacterium sp.]